MQDLYTCSRQGITPVVSVVLLLLILIVLSASVFVWFGDVLTGSQETSSGLSAQFSVVSLQCNVGQDSGDELFFGLKNRGKQDIAASRVDVYIRDTSGNLVKSITGLNWENKAFTDAGGFDTVTVSASETWFEQGQYYEIEIVFSSSDITLNVGQCFADLPSANPVTASSQNLPVTTDSYATTDWTDTPQDVPISCQAADGSDCTQVEWQVYDGNNNIVDSGTVTGTTATVTVGDDADGALTVLHRGTDENGTVGSWNSTLVKVDKTPPHTYIADDGDWYSSDFTKSVEDTEDDSNPPTCDYQTNDGGTGWTNWKSRQCGQVSITVGSNPSTNECSTEGQDQCGIKVRATNQAGDSETYTEYLNIDYSKPSLQRTGPSTGSTYSDDFTVTVSESDAVSGVNTCNYRTKDDGDAWTNWRPRNCTTGTFNVTVGSSGDCTTPGTDTCQVEIASVDKAGNTRTVSARFDIQLDTTGPTTAILGPDTGHTYTTNFTVTVNDTAGANPLSTCEYSINSGSWQTRSCPDGLFTVTVGSSRDCGTGSCTVDVRTTDANGNTASDTRSYDVDTSSSEVTFAQNEEVDLYNTDSTLIWGNAHTYYVEQLTMYTRTLGVGQRYNLSVYTSSDQSVNTTINTHQLNTFSYGSPILDMNTVANAGTTVNFQFTGATDIAGAYALYKDGAKMQDLASGGTLSWTDSGDGTGHTYEVIPE